MSTFFKTARGRFTLLDSGVEPLRHHWVEGPHTLACFARLSDALQLFGYYQAIETAEYLDSVARELARENTANLKRLETVTQGPFHPSRGHA